MTDLEPFAEVHVISDIHMGGKPGFQILRETGRLANFIGWVGQQRPGEQVALVLNGDVIDTLAEDISGYVAVDDAVSTVKRIMDDTAFAPVWLALAAFVKGDGRKLVFVLGNHDIELAFPPVQRLILKRLAGDDLLARARIEFSTAGAGYTCDVGGARVYCIHGNEVDPWNYNRYEDLAKVSRRLNAGQSIEQSEWKPNAGTKMVKEVMNEVKRRYAWIDLLKPETAAAVGTLLVLDPTQAKKITQMFGIVGERKSGSAEVDQRLSAEGFDAPAVASAQAMSMDQILGPNLRQAAVHDTDAMLLAAERNFATPGAPMATGDQQLGTGQFIWERLTGWITGVGKEEALRRALVDWLEGDPTYTVDDRDDTFKQVSASVGPAIDFIVTGHTHLERAIDMGGRYYFNTGTWIRLLRLTDAMLKDTASFKAVYDVLVDGSMATIDKTKFGNESFVLDQTSSVSIRAEGGKVVGSLNHVVGDGSGAPKEIKSFAKAL
jgi:UDP-2,3-diacylglucosamine pyrophosphatase LpxH